MLKKVHFINQVGEMDTNTIRDLTQRSLSSRLIRLSRSVTVVSLNLIRLSRSITPVLEIDPDRFTDLGRLNTNGIRLSRSITPVNEIDDETVRDLGRLLNPNDIRLFRSITPVNEINDETVREDNREENNLVIGANNDLKDH